MYVNAQNLNYVINAESEDNLIYSINDYDVILVAPQLTHHYERIQHLFAGYGKVIGLIPMQDYGLANGEGLIRFAEKIYQEKNSGNIYHYEDEIMQIITCSAKAKKYTFQALDYIKKKQYAKASSAVKAARKALLPAHQLQARIIEVQLNENSRTNIETNLLMVHAQDHLMSTITTLDLVEHMIGIFEKQ